MTNYFLYKIKLSDIKKQKLGKAFKEKSAITLNLKKTQLSGSDEIMLTQQKINKLQKSKNLGKGTD